MWKTILRHPVKATTLLLILIHHHSNAQPELSYQPFIGASEGLSAPMEVVSAPGDPPSRFFIVEKSGTIRIWNGTGLTSQTFLDISDLVSDAGEQGLLSMAFHPQYQSNGFFFVYYTNNDGNIAIARYQVSSDPDLANPTANPATPLLVIPKDYENHNGGHLQFRTQGGVNYLYFATGDGGSGNDPNNNAQNPSSLLGKMLRLDVDSPGASPEMWAMGLRNPFRWSFDRSTGDIWIGDVGQGAREEINFRPGGSSGANYGWACVEGFMNNPAPPAGADCNAVRDIDVLPVFDYTNPTEGRSVIGGYVYRGSEFPSLQGYYIATDFYSGRLWMIRPAGSSWEIIERTGFPTGISSISETSDGTLYAVSLNAGIVYKLVTPIVTPLNLLNFSGTPANDYNDLKWVTESEQNMDRYLIEYSHDGNTYQVAGEVVSGNYAERHTYQFRHQAGNAPLTYYRLMMREPDGTFNYSPVVSISAEPTGETKIYPTAITNGIVNIISPQPVERVVVTNLCGMQVFTREMNGTSGYFNLTLPTLQKGMYIISLSGRDFRKTGKIFIQ